MNQLVPIAAYGTLIAAAGECAQERFASDATAFRSGAFATKPTRLAARR